jgi:hypothetical protein
MLSIRARWLFVVLLLVFLALAYTIPGIEFETGTLALLASSLVLYVLCVVLATAAQQRRIGKLTIIIRTEANTLFNILVATRELPEQSREKLQDLVAEYVAASFRHHPYKSEFEYEHLVAYCLEYRGKDPETVQKILAGLSANQTNRTRLATLLNNSVPDSIWLLLVTLFVISLGFVLTLNTLNPAGQAVQAFVCATLSLQAFNLFKLSHLVHKKAQSMWRPFDTLKISRFRRFD